MPLDQKRYVTGSQNILSVYIPYFVGSYILLFDHLHRVIASGVIPLDSVFLVIGSYFFVPTYVSGILFFFLNSSDYSNIFSPGLSANNALD